MKRILIITTFVIGAFFAYAVWRATPWQLFPTPDAPTTDFTQEQIASAHQLRTRLRWLTLTPWLLTLLATLALGLFSARIFGKLLPSTSPIWQTLYAVAAITALMVLIRIPFSILALRTSRSAGLSTTTWGTWALDLVKNTAISIVLTWLALAALSWAARTLSSWWAFASLAAAVVTVVVSFLAPVIFEPIFNKFTPMPEGPLRTSLMQLAEKDGVPVSQVLIADASRRTTSLNAYVSGFGSTRRIVVYDTLLKETPQAEIESIAAHELGHAKENDVFLGTALGAIGAAFGVLLLALILGTRIGDPKYVASILAVFSLLSLAQQPLASLVSRQIELRADRHALNLTRDATTYAAMQKRLASINRSDLLTPRWVYLLFATHPSTMERITFARQWARENGAPVPGPMADK